MTPSVGGFEPPRFGTDGLRGLAGVAPMDTETLARVGAALGIWLQQEGPPGKRVLVGHDGRESASWILTALARGLGAADVAVTNVGLCTTPSLSFLTRTEPFSAGIVISASHNPAADNGIKIFAADGTKLGDEAERTIASLASSVQPDPGLGPRIAQRRELLARYEEHLGNLFIGLDLSPFRIAVDAANGGASELAPVLLRRLGAEVVPFACRPDGTNINAGVGALHPEHLGKHMKSLEADLGICLDGDGDRSIFLDETGQVRNGDEVLAVLARDMDGRGALHKHTVVATVMSNLGLHKALAEAEVHLEITAVGDRHVIRAMREGSFSLGGEQSGHIVFDGDGEHSGDGLFTALKLLSLPDVSTSGFAAAFAGFRHYPQVLLNVPVREKPDLAGIPAVQATLAGIERALGDEGRVLLRYSGTEPLCRVMVEGLSAEVVRGHADALALAVTEALNR